MKELAYALLAIAFCLMLAASSVSAKETITIKDDLGRDVTISSPSERVVFTMENALKTYYAVGRPQECGCPEGRQMDAKADGRHLSRGRSRIREEDTSSISLAIS